MNFLITGIPADPPDDDRLDGGSLDTEGAAPSNQYLTKHDFFVILGVLAVATLVFSPLIKRAFDDRLRYDCGQNFKAISGALGAYMAANDDQFPPTYLPGGNDLEPAVDDKGRPDTWATTLANLAGFDPRRSFSCPAAGKDEVMIAEGVAGADLPMTYGMYAPYGAVPRSSAADAASAVIITETASGGANGTYDPHPMPATGGKVRDGFLIGWSTGDFIPPGGKTLPPPSVTRLAIPHSASGLSFKLAQGRHDDSTYVLFADGHYRLMKVGKLVDPKYWALPGH